MVAPRDTDIYRYRAYTSYSHQDEKWAAWLHKKLEAYRVPRRLVGRKSTRGIIPRRIAPVFRNREELPTATDLGEVITRAIRESASLIVICSPHAARSRWVNEEILTFKRLGRIDRIFFIMVGGETGAEKKPELEMQECFPEALRLGIGLDGAPTDRTMEPIAADARKGKDGKADAR